MRLVKIYFLTGHEEQAIDDFDQNRGYSQTKEELKNRITELRHCL